jgi:hypothetical protein
VFTSGWLVQNGVIRLLDVWSLGLLTRRLAPSFPEARIALLHRNGLKAAAVGPVLELRLVSNVGLRVGVFFLPVPAGNRAMSKTAWEVWG